MPHQGLDTPTTRILLVDDGRMEAIVVGNLLRDSPLARLLYVAEDGDEALAFLRREGRFEDAEPPDVILLDINMPRTDGFEVLAEIRSDPALSKYPVVMFTTSGDQNDVDRAYTEGANAYITKPFDVQDFEETLRSFVEFWARTVRLPTRPGLPALRD